MTTISGLATSRTTILATKGSSNNFYNLHVVQITPSIFLL
jgi:hypothetical protein